jgi:hypothetical protein
MEKLESSCSVLTRLNLDNAKYVVGEAYHRDGTDRLQKKPIDVFKALVAKRLLQVPSNKELYRRLRRDSEMREPCDLEDE